MSGEYPPCVNCLHDRAAHNGGNPEAEGEGYCVAPWGRKRMACACIHYSHPVSGWNDRAPRLPPPPKKRTYTAREYRQLADRFHHPEPVDQGDGLFSCAVCDLPLYYGKRVGWVHERIKHQGKVIPEVERQVPLF